MHPKGVWLTSKTYGRAATNQYTLAMVVHPRHPRGWLVLAACLWQVEVQQYGGTLPHGVVANPSIIVPPKGEHLSLWRGARKTHQPNGISLHGELRELERVGFSYKHCSLIQNYIIQLYSGIIHVHAQWRALCTECSEVGLSTDSFCVTLSRMKKAKVANVSYVAVFG